MSVAVAQKPVILGMNNPSRLHRGEALSVVPSGSAGRNLLKYSGMTAPQFIAAFERKNVLVGRRWSQRAARAAGDELRRTLSGRSVVVLGRSPWAALSLPRGVPWFSCWVTENLKLPYDPRRTTWFLVPHTSGRCRTYNDRRNRAKLRKLLEQLT